MFDFDQRGTVEAHHYRSHYDAQAGSTTPCAFCGRTIRYCYAMQDQHGKTFVIGTCEFRRYKGTRTYSQLQASKVVLEALTANILRDQRFYGDKGEVRNSRRMWTEARRKGARIVRSHIMLKGDWLPKELFELKTAAEEKPRQYKRQSAAKRWYEQQTEKIITLTNQATSI
jgi:hypothetical protein